VLQYVECINLHGYRRLKAGNSANYTSNYYWWYLFGK